MNQLLFYRHSWPVLAACLFCGAAVHAQTIAINVGLSFGAFVAGTGGTIAVTSGSARGRTGGVMLLPQGGIATTAQFSVTGNTGDRYAITLPANDTVVLSDGNNHSMAVNKFVSYSGATGALPGGGTQILSVGATLTVSPAQPPGNYAGSFSVTVNYN